MECKFNSRAEINGNHLSFNRTKVECKLSDGTELLIKPGRFNRTKVECKCINDRYLCLCSSTVLIEPKWNVNLEDRVALLGLEQF